MSHFGVPKEFGNDYLLKGGADPDSCNWRIRTAIDNMIMDDDHIEAGFETRNQAVDNTMMNMCDEIECQLRNRCNSYIESKKRFKQDEELTDEQKAMIRQMSTWAQTAGGMNG